MDLFNGTFFIVPLSEGSEFFPDGDDERFFKEVKFWREKEEGWNFKKNFPKLNRVMETVSLQKKEIWRKKHLKKRKTTNLS